MVFIVIFSWFGRHNRDRLVCSLRSHPRRCWLPRSFGSTRPIVRLTCICRVRRHGQLLHFCADRPEWTVLVLLLTETVDVRAIWSIDRLLESDRKILLEVCLLWPLLAYDVGCDIIGLLVREHRGVKSGADGHVVHRISRGSQKAAHSGAVVVAVGTPERRKLISRAGLGALPQAIRAMACGAYLRKNLRAATGIGSACWLFDPQRASALKFRADGNAGRQPAHIS